MLTFLPLRRIGCLPSARRRRPGDSPSSWATWLVVFGAFLFSTIPARAQTFGSPTLTITAYHFTNITTDATTVVKSSPGILHTICINTPAATETITIYDSLTASGTKLGTITLFASTNPCFTYDANFATGLTVVTATAAGDITVSFQ